MFSSSLKNMYCWKEINSLVILFFTLWDRLYRFYALKWLFASNVGDVILHIRFLSYRNSNLKIDNYTYRAL